MDGIEELSGVTVVAATNRPDVLVSCFLYRSRFDPWALREEKGKEGRKILHPLLRHRTWPSSHLFVLALTHRTRR
jgi:ATP-dependent Zn protease